ncbi:MAG: hypothetical protein U0166_10960 [Acidobacteriota bacterium]
MIGLLALTVAIVVEDGSTLRASPSDTAARQADLFRGDWLEVRGRERGYVKVWDHRHERPGYVRTWRVREVALDEGSAPDLRAVTLFLRDAPGFESLGLGYAALFLKAAPGGDVRSDVYDAIGTMADRLARRASSKSPVTEAATLAGHLEVASSLGVGLLSSEHDGRARLVYDGEAFRRVLATSSDPGERARAALALTRDDGLATDAGPVAIKLWNEWRIGVLHKADPYGLPPEVAGRLRARGASVLAWLAHTYGTLGQPERAIEASDEALRQLLLVRADDLMPEDRAELEEATLRVACSRFAAAPPMTQVAAGRLAVEALPAPDGGTCVRVIESGGRGPRTVLERETYGQVWLGSARASGLGNAVAVTVQPLPSWTELWMLHRTETGWQLDTLAPAPISPGVGYAEAAGFSPDGSRILVAREALVDGKRTRSFEIRNLQTLAVEKQADNLDHFPSFRKWASAEWRASNLAQR